MLPLAQHQQWIGRQRADGELLSRFLIHRDEIAFAALVARYERMVLAVCRRVLHHLQDAEDARQNVFIVLEREVPSLLHQETIGGWLRGVAHRIALKTLRGKKRRQDHERRCGNCSPAHPVQPVSEAIIHELQTTLNEEVHRLREEVRAPFALHYLEGKSKVETAQILGWKEGTVSSRLAEARKFLRQQLRRSGYFL